jgi:hypothetical protein
MLSLMTPEQAANSQVWAAWAQVILAGVVSAATIYFARLANRLQALQLAGTIQPNVVVDIEVAPYIAEPSEPLNFIRVENRSAVSLSSVYLSAESFTGPEQVNHSATHSQETPIMQWPDFAPRASELYCIDEVISTAMETLKLLQHPAARRLHFIRFHVRYERAADGTPGRAELLVSIYARPGIRPVAVYPPRL